MSKGLSHMLSSRFHCLIQYACAFCFYGNQVVEADLVLVSSLTLSVPTRASTKALMAVGKGSGCISAWEFDVSWCCTRIACQLKAHDQVVRIYLSDGIDTGFVAIQL
jgi:hypothetical protein